MSPARFRCATQLLLRIDEKIKAPDIYILSNLFTHCFVRSLRTTSRTSVTLLPDRVVSLLVSTSTSSLCVGQGRCRRYSLTIGLGGWDAGLRSTSKVKV